MLRRTPLVRKTPLSRGGSAAPTIPAEPPAKRSTLRPVSKKRQRLNRERANLPQIAAARITPHICPVPDCTNLATSPHEPLTRARGGSIIDPTNVVMICWPHNQELTLEPAWGYELGFLRHSWEAS